LPSIKFSTFIFRKCRCGDQGDEENAWYAPGKRALPAKRGMVTLTLLTNIRRRNRDSQWERVAYVQLPHAVAYIVLSARDEASYRKDLAALRQAENLHLLEPKNGAKLH